MLLKFVDIEPCIAIFSEHMQNNPADLFRCHEVGFYNWKSNLALRRSYDLEEFVKILRNIGHWKNFEEQLGTFNVDQIILHCHTHHGRTRPHCEFKVTCHQQESVCSKPVLVQTAYSDEGRKSGTSSNSAEFPVMMSPIVVIILIGKP